MEHNSVQQQMNQAIFMAYQSLFVSPVASRQIGMLHGGR